jgi:hypothetical protein
MQLFVAPARILGGQLFCGPITKCPRPLQFKNPGPNRIPERVTLREAIECPGLTGIIPLVR